MEERPATRSTATAGLEWAKRAQASPEQRGTIGVAAHRSAAGDGTAKGRALACCSMRPVEGCVRAPE